jgi:DNA primase catalytic subunit
MSREGQSRYLQYYFPLDAICKMYSAGNDSGGGEFIYRHLALSWDDTFWHDTQLTITNVEQFRKLLFERVPKQIHFSRYRCSVFNNPRTLKEQKELVFDVDITDFKRYCPCGTEKRVCSLCWLHIEGAVFVLRYILIHVFGLSEAHFLWVYSGLKGFHCLVNDRVLRQFNEVARANMIQLLDLVGQEDRMKTFIQSCDVDFLSQLEIQFYNRAIIQRQILSQSQFQSDCLNWIQRHFSSIYQEILVFWTFPHHSQEKWDKLREVEAIHYRNGMKPSHWIAMQCFYPVIDKGPLALNTNFKVPFSVHKETKKLALPFACEDFLLCDNTHTLPGYTLQSLLGGEERTKEAFEAGILRFNDWLRHY